MGELLPNIAPFLNACGWLAVIVLVLVSVIRGWFVPASHVDKIIKAYERILDDKDKQIADWREAYNNSDARGDVFAENQRLLVESVKDTNNLIQQLVYRPLNQRETAG